MLVYSHLLPSYYAVFDADRGQVSVQSIDILVYKYRLVPKIQNVCTHSWQQSVVNSPSGSLVNNFIILTYSIFVGMNILTLNVNHSPKLSS